MNCFVKCVAYCWTLVYASAKLTSMLFITLQTTTKTRASKT